MIPYERTKKWRKENPEKWREYYRNYWIGKRKKLFVLVGKKCSICNSEKNLHIHHIDGKGARMPKNKQNNRLDNLITLCPKCHYEVEIKRRGSSPYTLKGRWSMKFDKCVICGKNDSKYHFRGSCVRCYELKRREYKTKYWREHYSKSAIDRLSC